MSFKKLLGIISVVIIVVFSMMLTTSYAWYSFENPSTTFSGVTNSDDITVSFQRGEYINTSIAVPISEKDVDRYAEKSEFSISVKDESKTFELVVTVSLVEINIADNLKDSNFLVDLLYLDEKVASISGADIVEDNIKLGDITLDSSIANDFALRVYILDDGTDQAKMMNQTFSAKVQVNVISRLMTNLVDWTGADISISSIVIDGEEKNYLPTNGYYNMTYKCTKGSKLSWDSLNKTISYTNGSNISDSCSLNFTSSDNIDYPLLSEMPVGSYVKYTGTNGCDGNSCEGQNVNYVNDTNMGYSQNEEYKFYTNGFRIAYVEDSSAYLISAGAIDSMCTSLDGKSSPNGCNTYLDLEKIDEHLNNMNKVALKYCNSKYIKDGVCDSSTVWAMNSVDFEKITKRALNNNSCYKKFSNIACGYTNDLIDNGGYYWLATTISLDSSVIHWDPNYRYVGSSIKTSELYGIRPVLKLDSKVVVTGGDGTYNDPYVIDIK